MTIGTNDQERIIGELRYRASYHHWVWTITAASAAIVLLAGAIPAVAWIRDPFLNISHSNDPRVLILNSSVRVFALTVVAYLVRLLTSIYRYNTQLWNHYATRALALELAADGKIPLLSAVAALSASTVSFGKDGLSLEDLPIPSNSH
jgi:hypothetical protein